MRITIASLVVTGPFPIRTSAFSAILSGDTVVEVVLGLLMVGIPALICTCVNRFRSGITTMFARTTLAATQTPATWS
jgi:hypothetical protein